jgi:hypothetical protein
VRLLKRFAAEYPRYGYRRLWKKVRDEDIDVSLKIVYRLWTRHVKKRATE